MPRTFIFPLPSFDLPLLEDYVGGVRLHNLRIQSNFLESTSTSVSTGSISSAFMSSLF